MTRNRNQWLSQIHAKMIFEQNLQTKERRAMPMNITYSDLIQLMIFIVALVGLCYEIFKEKKQPPTTANSERLGRVFLAFPFSSINIAYPEPAFKTYLLYRFLVQKLPEGTGCKRKPPGSQRLRFPPKPHTAGMEGDDPGSQHRP